MKTEPITTTGLLVRIVIGLLLVLHRHGERVLLFRARDLDREDTVGAAGANAHELPTSARLAPQGAWGRPDR